MCRARGMWRWWRVSFAPRGSPGPMWTLSGIAQLILVKQDRRGKPGFWPRTTYQVCGGAAESRGSDRRYSQAQTGVCSLVTETWGQTGSMAADSWWVTGWQSGITSGRLRFRGHGGKRLSMGPRGSSFLSKLCRSQAVWPQVSHSPSLGHFSSACKMRALALTSQGS